METIDKKDLEVLRIALYSYLPYEVQIKNEASPNGFITLSGTHIDMLSEELPFIPFVRPLSDLVKMINHKGEEFIPIRKMYGLLNEGVDLNKDWEDSYLNIRKGEFNDVMWDTESKEIKQFGYNDSHKCFYQRLYDNDLVYICDLNQTNQLDLFHMMYELHIDVWDLIGKGLA